MERTKLISDYHEQFTIFYERASQYSKLLSEKHIVDDALDKERLKLTYTFYRDILNIIDATPWFEIIKWTKELKKEIKHIENEIKSW